MGLSAEERVRAVKQRIATYEKKRSEKLALLQMQRAQYNKIVGQVAELGVAKVNDLPATLKALEDELVAMLTDIEAKLDEAESLVNGI
jgi:hypothetical protein